MGMDKALKDDDLNENTLKQIGREEHVFCF